MTSQVEICNMALSHLGVGKAIANLTTEKSQEAAACNLFFDTVRDAVLGDFAWPFATKFVTLELIEEFTDSTAEWGFSYRYPVDCIKFRRILSGSRNDSRQTRVPFRLVEDESGTLIYTDKEDAEGEYTVRQEDYSRFSADFTLAMSVRLAINIAPRLTKGDPFKIKKDLMVQYQGEITPAEASATNEEQPEERPESEFISSRR